MRQPDSFWSSAAWVCIALWCSQAHSSLLANPFLPPSAQHRLAAAEKTHAELPANYQEAQDRVQAQTQKNIEQNRELSKKNADQNRELSARERAQGNNRPSAAPTPPSNNNPWTQNQNNNPWANRSWNNDNNKPAPQATTPPPASGWGTPAQSAPQNNIYLPQSANPAPAEPRPSAPTP